MSHQGIYPDEVDIHFSSSQNSIAQRLRQLCDWNSHLMVFDRAFSGLQWRHRRRTPTVAERDVPGGLVNCGSIGSILQLDVRLFNL